MELGISAPKLKSLLRQNPLKSRFLVLQIDRTSCANRIVVVDVWRALLAVLLCDGARSVRVHHVAQILHLLQV